MMANIANLYDTTMRLVERIDEADSDELSNLIELRDEIIHELQLISVIPEDGKQMLRKIGEFDEVIFTRMNGLRDEASRGLEKIKKTRMQKQVYEQSYVPESYFVDRKE